jgi:hypothetical protein
MRPEPKVSPRPGSIYKVCGRLYVDSQAVQNLTARREVVPTAGGWRVLDAQSSLEFIRVDRAPLPGQHGALYQLRAEGQTPEQAQSWFDERLLVPRADLETWPGEPASSCACDHACACAPCRQKHEGKP